MAPRFQYLLYHATDDQLIAFYQRQSPWMKDQILASSSRPSQSFSKGLYRHYACLPNVFEDPFAHQAQGLITQHGITSIFCSNDFVAQQLTHKLPHTPVILVGDGLFSLTQRYQGFEKEAQAFANHFHKTYQRLPRLSLSQMAEILYSISCIFGESQTNKVLHFVDLLEQCPPQGIVIEAGALMGKQSVGLALLGQVYPMKALYIIDPWSPLEAPQHDAHQSVTDFPQLLSWDTIKKICQAHLRNHRGDGVHIVQDLLENVLPDLSGISLIHLDGNHDYAAVSRQLQLLADKMLPGGCILCDDYLWPLGDSVKQAVDDFISQQGGRLSRTLALDENLALFFK